MGDTETFLKVFREINTKHLQKEVNDTEMIALKRSGKRGKEARAEMIKAKG